MSYLDPSGICDSLTSSDPMWVCSGCEARVTGSYSSWLRSNCPLEYQQVYRQVNGVEQAQTYANNLLDGYFNSNSDTGFQEVLHQFCNNPGINPGVCQNYITYKKCVNVPYDTMTAEQADWCGCIVMPSLADQELYGTNIACYPLCHLTDTIQLVDEDGIPIQCNNQVCVIDDVSINVTESKVGDVTINSICPGCTGNCNCVINNVDVSGVDLDINQYCGPNTSCYITRGSELVQVPCTPSRRVFDNIWILLLVIIIVIISIVVILIVIYQAARR